MPHFKERFLDSPVPLSHSTVLFIQPFFQIVETFAQLFRQMLSEFGIVVFADVFDFLFPAVDINGRKRGHIFLVLVAHCLLYTSDAADEL